ncbi:alanyl-tRNA editing protein [Aureimonas jatrophae]|uniref:Ala-tRNA(Pro) hydrolase n=1 Tax=Aureimonas jatrophae TaxID=1166073 RepID=A0A1H0GV29_9HYPH|nr:alanyl-tRNA editing protein [Aureimonas jatrophae]SDO10750.1 Ala-tRNA(Pro) hydrolase [Aureimonas jatrophae]
MSTATEAAYLDDAYLSTLESAVVGLDGETGIAVARSNFYPAGGGQPGDTGFIEREDGRQISIVDTRRSDDRLRIVLVAAPGSELPSIGETVVLHVDWARRYKLMRMHTALHLLTVVCPYPVTGAAVGEDEGRIDFDWPEADIDKEAVTLGLQRLVDANHAVGTRWITDDELDANPGLVKSANVKPPRGSGRVRLVTIGLDGAIDSQPCGGTHVLETREIGTLHVGKVEKKGRTNRRIRLRFGDLP